MKYDELTINKRQKKDNVFSELLNSVRGGEPSEETLKVFRERVIETSMKDKE